MCDKAKLSVEERFQLLNAQKESFRLRVENIKKKVAIIDNCVKTGLDYFPNPDKMLSTKIHNLATKVR